MVVETPSSTMWVWICVLVGAHERGTLIAEGAGRAGFQVRGPSPPRRSGRPSAASRARPRSGLMPIASRPRGRSPSSAGSPQTAICSQVVGRAAGRSAHEGPTGRMFPGPVQGKLPFIGKRRKALRLSSPFGTVIPAGTGHERPRTYDRRSTAGLHASERRGGRNDCTRRWRGRRAPVDALLGCGRRGSNSKPYVRCARPRQGQPARRCRVHFQLAHGGSAIIPAAHLLAMVSRQAYRVSPRA